MKNGQVDGPAYHLEGLKLDGGWTVLGIVQKQPRETGGNFSVGYRVRDDDGTEAFLKALDLTRALAHQTL